jgi:hypothetical protein
LHIHRDEINIVGPRFDFETPGIGAGRVDTVAAGPRNYPEISGRQGLSHESAVDPHVDTPLLPGESAR